MYFAGPVPDRLLSYQQLREGKCHYHNSVFWTLSQYTTFFTHSFHVIEGLNLIICVRVICSTGTIGGEGVYLLSGI